ncbi:hypothetical protein [Marinomonas sp. IMCC 4694]|uniref:hypothetical protein n=1 Tax=Marinomonas sp. IMCC 4694 TaxID=2605432 RepID=UPI0011E872ED|nr:hypothetical protein [Marinomonas sp. IMCC 4694]TYL47193.1 hypothetical protein FXV75_04085 [Marinomonas sp. IMCC 4694]
MNRMNYKAIVLVFILQLVIGLVWYTSSPASLSSHVAQVGSGRPEASIMLLFAGAILAYVFFMAWLLTRVNAMSILGRVLFVVSVWLCIVLPNYVFVAVHLNMTGSDTVYLLAYGALNCAIAATILPLWPSSRSIFRN